MLNLAMLLEISARREPGKVALMLDDMKLRYAEVNGAANKIANGLVGLGVRPGDKVALMLPNTPHFVMTDVTGHFRLGGLPAGHYTLKAWIDSRTTLEKSVQLKSGGTLHVDFP